MATLAPTGGGTPANGGATGSLGAGGSGGGGGGSSALAPAGGASLPAGGASSSASGGSSSAGRTGASAPSALSGRAKVVCPECGSADIDYDITRGDAACVDCGTVVETTSIVSEVGFVGDARGRSSAVGQMVRADGTPAFGALPGFSRQSSEITTANARRRMLYLVAALRLAPRCAESGMRLFQLSAEQQFHKGRRLSVVCAAALYVVCRLERSPHMLLDFSDVLETNVYTLGRAVGKFCRLLALELPAVDPSLYIHRFAGRLEYGDATQTVALSALRLIARMRRDWMAEGRRPAGLCGAALLVASRMHNFYRSTAEVVRVVRVGSAVLHNRLRELDATPSAALTAREIDIGGGDEGAVASLLNVTEMEVCDPPAWTRAHAADAKKGAGDKGRDMGSEKSGDKDAADSATKAAAAALKVYELGADDAPRRMTRAGAAAVAAAAAAGAGSKDPLTGPPSTAGPPAAPASTDAALLAAGSQVTPSGSQVQPASSTPPVAGSVEAQMAAAMASPELAALEAEAAADAAATTAATALFHAQGRAADAAAAAADAAALAAAAASKQGAAGGAAAAADDDDGSLGELDEEELGGYLNTTAEAAVKTSIWSELNREYLDAQAELETLRREDPVAYAKRRPWKRKRAGVGSGRESGSLPPPRTAAEAASREFARRKSSKKINYDVLKDLFSDGTPGGAAAAGGVAASTGGGAEAGGSAPGASAAGAGTPGGGSTSASLPPLYPSGRGGAGGTPLPPLPAPLPVAEPPELDSSEFYF
ncbi:hypothetical protein MMPV_007322 [Pyropia vietnamensis]